MKRLISVLILTAGLGIYIQAQVPSRDDSIVCKLIMYLESDIMPGAGVERTLANFMQTQISIDTLESKGFRNYTFLKIIPYVGVLPGQLVSEDTLEDAFPMLGSDEFGGYIIAKENASKTIYRVQNFYINDLAALFFIDYDREILRKRKFLRTHSVEGLDLECLYEAWKANSFDMEKYPCMQYRSMPIVAGSWGRKPKFRFRLF